jgi:FlaA1/EpsC-like NDP-sugar epimerase
MKAEPSTRPRGVKGGVRARRRAPGWVVPAVKAALMTTDALIAVAAFVAAYKWREGGELLLRFSLARGFEWHPSFEPYAALLWLLIPIRVLALGYYDLYRLRGEFSYLDDCVRVFKAVAVGSLLVIAAAFLYRGGIEFRAYSYSRAVFVLDFALALAAYVALRLATRASPLPLPLRR